MSTRRIAASIATAAAAIALATVAAPGQASAEPQTEGVWVKAALTVHVADVAAWAGTDVQAALAQWSPALPMTLTDSPDADVTLTSGTYDEYVGANTRTTASDGVLTSCRVDINTAHAGDEFTQELTHELGHCLGLDDNTLTDTHEPSVMYFMAYGSFFSPTVTATDLNNVRSLYL